MGGGRATALGAALPRFTEPWLACRFRSVPLEKRLRFYLVRTIFKRFDFLSTTIWRWQKKGAALRPRLKRLDINCGWATVRYRLGSYNGPKVLRQAILCLVYHTICDDNVISGQKAVKVLQGVCDLRARTLVLEQIRKHSGGLCRLVGFAKFGKPSERCPVGAALFDPRGSGVPPARGAQGSRVFAVNVDVVRHTGDDCSTGHGCSTLA